MAITLRSVVLAVVPSLTLLVGGLFWFRRKKPNKLESLPKPPDKSAADELISQAEEALQNHCHSSAGDVSDDTQKEEACETGTCDEAAAANDCDELGTAIALEDSVRIEAFVDVVNKEAFVDVVNKEAFVDVVNKEAFVDLVEIESLDEVLKTEDSDKEVKAEASDEMAEKESFENAIKVEPYDEAIITVNSQSCNDEIPSVFEEIVVKQMTAELSAENTPQEPGNNTSTEEVNGACDCVNADEAVDVIVSDRFMDNLPDVSDSVLDWAQEASDNLSDADIVPETALCVENLKSSPKSNTVEVNSIKDAKSDENKMAMEVEQVTSSSLLAIQPSLSIAIDSPHSVASDSTDAQSELSNDSGKASSINEAPIHSVTAIPEESLETLPISDVKVYEFDFPSGLIGMLIGRFGKGVNHIKQHSGVEVTIKNKLYTTDTQLVSLMGTSKQIEKALSVIKSKFPKSRFKQYNLDFSEAQPESPMLPPEVMQLSLPEGILIDVTVSSVVSGNHVFVQQPTHPSYPSLEMLNQCMMTCYHDDNLIPDLPRPIDIGVLCAAPMYNSWFRAQVVQSYPDTDECDVKFVDYGGYLHIPGYMLKQIRSDFTSLPFQSIEVYLANVMPCNGTEEFDVEACSSLEELVKGQMLQAEVVSHDEDTGIPYINLYTTQQNKTWLLNRMLVEKGLASWAEDQ